MDKPRRVCYVHSEELQRVADALPSNLGRASLVHSLVSCCGLLDDAVDSDDPDESSKTARVISPTPATRSELEMFHDGDLIDTLMGSPIDSGSSEASDTDDSDDDRHRRNKRRKLAHHATASSLVDDCPPFPLLSRYVALVAGASLTAARELRDGRADIAIAWTGGRHHASRGEAKGFCYVNDIVLAIMELRKKPLSSSRAKLSKILYLDLDLHHGDAVESAFFASPFILTLSLHLHAPLFYPNTGALDSSGPLNPKAQGRGHALNLALESGLSGPSLERIWQVIENVKTSFAPDAIVVQCGLDGLNGDPCKEWNLSLSDYSNCIASVLAWNLPTLLLGGGGYNSPNAARTWTHLTSLCLGRPLAPSTQVPAALPSGHYEQFGPSFTLDVERNDNLRDRNNDVTLTAVESAFEGYCETLSAKWKTGKRIVRAELEKQEASGKKRVRFQFEPRQEQSPPPLPPLSPSESQTPNPCSS
ncbi:uncharacterized protein JCM15063_001653 [Sporobolomyces koalae]|uniref:uncharacterized protein n=1 Tax=Sporobolomyces koalae TaxID=500713 RepID=UPI00317BF67B